MTQLISRLFCFYQIKPKLIIKKNIRKKNVKEMKNMVYLIDILFSLIIIIIGLFYKVISNNLKNT